jgi:hypothetical protein
MKTAALLLASLLALPLVACGGAAAEVPPATQATASLAADPEWNPGDGFDMKVADQAQPEERTQLAQPSAHAADRPNMPSKAKHSLVTLTHKAQ